MGRTHPGFRGEFIDRGNYPGRIQVPFDEKAIGGQATMERAGGNPVKIGDVTAGNGAKAIYVEMCVLGFEWVEGPLDEAEATPESIVPLKQFQLAADAAIAVGREDGGHVRVEIRSVIVQTDEGFRKSDHGVAIKCPEDLPSGMVGDDICDMGFGIQFCITPNFAGDLNTTMKFLERMERTNSNVGGHGRTNYKLSSLESQKRRPHWARGIRRRGLAWGGSAEGARGHVASGLVFVGQLCGN